MIFSKHELAFRLIDVLKIDNRNVHMVNRNRHFGAISYRVHSDAQIEYREKKIRMSDCTVSYFPHDINYIRDAQIDEIYVVHLSVIGYEAEEIESYVTKKPDEVERAFREIYEMWCGDRPDRYYRASAMFNELFAGLYEECRGTEGHSAYFTKAAAWIAGHYSESTLTIPQIADCLSVSEVYLRKIFQKEAGMSPKEYLSKFRIRQAGTCLLSGYYSVAEAAHACGFEDEKYFSVVFKKETGISPSEYRYCFEEPS